MNWCTPCDADILVDESETILECNYDTNVTSLYQAIEAEAWDPILTFIKNQKWSSMAFTKDALSAESQVRTWVTRFDPKGKVRWSQLPLHAAIIFRAPRKVVKALIELYPLSVQCTDDQRMLPLHLAFRVGANDSIMNLLMKYYPDALMMKDQHGKVPYAIEGRDIRKDYNESVHQIVKFITEKVKASEQKSSQLEINDVEDAMKEQSRLVTIMEDDNKDLVQELSVAQRELADFKERCRMLEGIIAATKSTAVPQTIRHQSDASKISKEEIASTTTSDLQDTNTRMWQEKATETITNLNRNTTSYRRDRKEFADGFKKSDFRMISSEKLDFGNTSLDTKDTDTTASQCTNDSAKINTDLNLIQHNKERDTSFHRIKRDDDRIVRTNQVNVAKELLDPKDTKVSVNLSTSSNLNLIEHGVEELEVILNDVKQTISKGSEIAMKFETKGKLINSQPSFVMREATEDLIAMSPVERTLHTEIEIAKSQKDSHPRKYLADESHNIDLTGMAMKIHEDQQNHALVDIIQTIVTSYQT